MLARIADANVPDVKSFVPCGEYFALVILIIRSAVGRENGGRENGSLGRLMLDKKEKEAKLPSIWVRESYT